MRADIFLFQNGYVKSRQRAKTLIESGNVKINGKIITKPSLDICEEVVNVEIQDDCPYVSRGGLKLEAILKLTKADMKDKVCLDIGASTGGFTHCLLLNGAKQVFAVDSGTNQLALELLEDERVIPMENHNARSLCFDDIGELVDVITIDVSFISQNLIMPNASTLLKEDGVYFSLIKPQFEVGRALIGKGGIVKDKKARLIAINSVLECAKQCGLICTMLCKSPIQGGDGNVEYLATFSRHGQPISQEYIKKIANE